MIILFRRLRTNVAVFVVLSKNIWAIVTHVISTVTVKAFCHVHLELHKWSTATTFLLTRFWISSFSGIKHSLIFRCLVFLGNLETSVNLLFYTNQTIRWILWLERFLPLAFVCKNYSSFVHSRWTLWHVHDAIFPFWSSSIGFQQGKMMYVSLSKQVLTLKLPECIS